MGGFSLWHWLVVLLVVVLVFGTKKLRNMGSDLGEAVRGFRKGLREDEPPPSLKADDNPDESVEKTGSSETQRH